MRISKTLQDVRKAEVLGLLTTNPKMTIKQVNEALKAKFGRAMHPKYIQEIRRGLVTPPTETQVDQKALDSAKLVVADLNMLADAMVAAETAPTTEGAMIPGDFNVVVAPTTSA